jgi:hypothetical protein
MISQIVVRNKGLDHEQYRLPLKVVYVERLFDVTHLQSGASSRISILISVQS